MAFSFKLKGSWIMGQELQLLQQERTTSLIINLDAKKKKRQMRHSKLWQQEKKSNINSECIHLQSLGLIGQSIKHTPFYLILHVPWVFMHVRFITRQPSPLLMRYLHCHDNFSVAVMVCLIWHERSSGRSCTWKHICNGTVEIYVLFQFLLLSLFDLFLPLFFSLFFFFTWLSVISG